MPRSTLVDRRATSEEVAAHAVEIRAFALRLGLGKTFVRRDGTVVVHSGELGYRSVTKLSAEASEAVGAYVHVITDDVPGAVDLREL